jgi:hypothetical protein
MKLQNITFLIVSLLLSSCGGGSGSENDNHAMSLADDASGDMDAYVSGNVNAIVQAKPEIMIMPSDGELEKASCLILKDIGGEQYTVRNYSKYLAKERSYKGISSHIQNYFNSVDYSLTDFEQSLKNLDTNNAMNLSGNIATDLKTQLLNVIHPDIILELYYCNKTDYISHKYTKSINYTINAIDAYTSKVIATISSPEMQGKSVSETVNEDLDKRLPKLSEDIQKYFCDILKRGREVVVTINVHSSSNQHLNDQSIEGDTYSDQIIDYIKTHTIKGAYKMAINTPNKLSFTNCRIKLLNADGTQYGVYDWARDFQKFLRKDLGLIVDNRSQGLGEITLTVKGI